ncbi:uncharacterized protein LOC132603431 isoform X2 [Lycium barbarum]|uniref:uncharacterized protein LOC132603431 isoform X2 n=1 Tax=Lycium barbarum TaxID=112863 RepID=UPI00293F1502|nr:uncharacterized protein LOC132603431 isoform X2 [Lycium barbarum]XP_060172471.1 uncharacterized protein LOC132603431 isoform X2 [Lycium barbarum]
MPKKEKRSLALACVLITCYSVIERETARFFGSRGRLKRGTTVCFTIDIAVSETIQDNKNCSVLPTLSRGSIGNRLSTLQRQRIERLRLLGSPLKLILRASEGMMGWNICRMCLKTNSSYILLALYLQ